MADESNSLNLIPKPRQLKRHDGSFAWDRNLVLVVDPADRKVLAPSRRAIERITGSSVTIPSNGAPVAGDGKKLYLKLERSLIGTLGREGYRLKIRPQEIEILAAAPAGVFYGTQTLRQMLPASSWKTPDAPALVQLPCVDIEDGPRFGWRGIMLDSSRHFLGIEFVKRYIDLAALHKLNVFHWHLTDDPGWRLEIKKYPKLTEIGAWRKESQLNHSHRDKVKTFDGIPHGGFFSQKQVREVVAYAAERYVTVVPEIDIPGHSRAAIASYPELSSVDHPLDVATGWFMGTESTVNVEPGTITFFQNVLGEVMDLFPSEFIHIGGDEALKDAWKANARVQQRMKELKLADEHELQSWFVRQMDQFLTASGRRLIGWDEILEGGLAPGATVMSWRGDAGGIAAAQAGHDVVMANNKLTYLDYYQADPDKEPMAIGGNLSLEKTYEFEAIPSVLTPEQAKHIIGGQMQLWTEYVGTQDYAEYMTYPRACSLAETLWSEPAGRSFAEFRPRLAAHLERLAALGVNYRALDQ